MGTYAKYALGSTTTKEKERKTIDISDIEKLKAEAEKRGLKVEEKKESFFRRTLDLLMRPVYASAGAAKALVKGENVAQEAYKGIRGIEKETYSDVLGEMGVQNKWVKGITGFALDVALDPTTYFGGALIKGGMKGVKAVATPVAKGYAKVAPESALHLADAAKNLKDAFGSAFQFGYGTSKGLANEVSRVVNKMGIAKEEIIAKNIRIFGKTPSPKKMERATELMMNNRLVEKGLKEGQIKYAQNPETNQLLNSMKQLGQEIATEAKIKNPDKWYFPWIDVERLNRSKINQSALLKMGSEGYRKQFRNLIGDDKLLKKPIEAYSRREYEVVRDNIASQTMKDMVATYGKQFKNPAEALKEGYKPIYKKGSLQFFKVKTTPAEDILKQVNVQTEPFERAMIKVGKGIEAAVKEGVPVSGTKKLRTMAGAYYPSTNEIKLKYFTPDVLLHERGHSWDFMNDKLSSVINTNKTFQKELKTLTEKFYGIPSRQGMAVEKWAVFIDKFVHDSRFVKSHAPTFTAYFRHKIKTDWKFKKAYDEAAMQIKTINKTVRNIKPALARADKGALKTAIETAFPSKEFVGVKKATPIGYLKETDAKFIDNYLYPEMKAIDVLAKATGYDTFTRWFKTAVTAYFPAFHVRNYISGNVQNYQVIGAQAFNPQNHNTALGIMRNLLSKKAQGKAVKLGGTVYDTKALSKTLQENFRGASRYISDIGEYVDEVVGGKFSMKKLSNARQVGNFIEMNQKAVAMVGALRQGKALPEAIKLAERAGFDYSKITKFESKIMKRAIPFYCVPTTHEILTKNGWKKYNDIKKGDKVLTSTIDGKLEWQPLLDIAIFDFAGMLKKFKRAGGKFLFTPEHRWLTETTKTKIKGKIYGGTRQIKRTYELNKSDIIPLTGKYINKKDFLSSRLIAILGWVVTDGYFRWRGNCCEMIIYQHPKKYLENIKQLTGNKERKPHPISGVCAVPVKQEDIKEIVKHFKSKADLSKIITKLSNTEIDAMYLAMMQAEGFCSNYVKNNYKIKEYGFSQCPIKNKDVIDAFQILLFLKGGVGNISQKGIYPKKTKYLRVKEGIEEEYYNGLIWCPKTKNGTWVMRNEGCMIITGNTFARKNAELQLRTLATKPERIINQAKFANSLSVMFGEKVSEEDVKGLPPWALSGLGFKVSGEKYFTKFGLPLEEFVERVNEPFKTTLSSLNPIIKFPLESKMGYDFFREQKIIDVDKVAPATGELLMKAKKEGKMPEWLDKALNLRSYEYKGKTYYEASPKILHFLRNIPTSRFQNTLERMFDKDLDKVNKWMAFLSGAKIYDIDIEMQKYFNERDLRRDIEDQLLERGIGQTHESFYIYK